MMPGVAGYLTRLAGGVERQEDALTRLKSVLKSSKFSSRGSRPAPRLGLPPQTPAGAPPQTPSVRPFTDRRTTLTAGGAYLSISSLIVIRQDA